MVRHESYLFTITTVSLNLYHWSYSYSFINLWKQSMDPENMNKKYKVRIVLKEVAEKSFKQVEASIEKKTEENI